MSNEKKISFKQWASFIIGAFSIIGKVVLEIIDLIPEKNT